MFEWLIGSGTSGQSFEFGPIEQRDRIQLAVNLKNAGQGQQLLQQTLPSDVLQSVGTSLDCKTVAGDVFKIFRNFFNQPTAEKLLKNAPVLGVMSDELCVNGLAGRLHIDESKCYVNVTAGTMLKGMVAVYRLLGDKALRLGGRSEIQDATSSYHPNVVFPMPRRLKIRKYATECAIYGTLAVFCHELAHVFRGHTLYVGSKLAADFLEETSLSLTSTSDGVRRLIELDADDFAGRFLAGILFEPFVTSKGLLNDTDGTKRFLKVATGVLALYLGFGVKSNVYYSGPVRAHLVLGSLLRRCSDDPENAAWLREQIADIQIDMVHAQLVLQSDVQLHAVELAELLNVSLPARDAIQQEWLTLRPWRAA